MTPREERERIYDVLFGERENVVRELEPARPNVDVYVYAPAEPLRPVLVRPDGETARGQPALGRSDHPQ